MFGDCPLVFGQKKCGVNEQETGFRRIYPVSVPQHKETRFQEETGLKAKKILNAFRCFTDQCTGNGLNSRMLIIIRRLIEKSRDKI